MSNYIDTNTVLLLQFNATLINPIFSSTTSYNTNSSTGLVNIKSWSSTYLATIKSQGFLSLTSISIANPAAAISYTISGIFYFVENAQNYTMQTIFSTITLNPIAFTTFTLTSPLSYGTLNTIDVVSSCNFTQLSSTNPSNPAYQMLTYNSSQIFSSSNSNCSSVTSSTCRTTSSGSYRLSSIQTNIANSASTNIMLTSFTFYQGVYYALCRSNFTITFVSQKISPSILTS